MRFILVSVLQTETKMGTYTTNYQLFMPTVGEQGWGELVNGNFEIIDTTMKGLNTRMGTAETNIISLTTRMGTAETTITSNKSRIGTLETESDALDSRIKVFEDNISFDSNGNIVGNIIGNAEGSTEGFLFVKGVIQETEGDATFATCNEQIIDYGAYSDSQTFTVNPYSIVETPIKHTWGVYSRRSDLSGISPETLSIRAGTLSIRNANSSSRSGIVYYKTSEDESYSQLVSYVTIGGGKTITRSISFVPNTTYTVYTDQSMFDMVITFSALPTYYVKYDRPL